MDNAKTDYAISFDVLDRESKNVLDAVKVDGQAIFRIKNNSDVFKSIKSKKSKQPVPFEVVQDFILKHSFEMLKSSYDTDGKSKLQKELQIRVVTQADLFPLFILW